MWKDAKNIVRSCEKYQRFAKVPHLNQEKLTVMPSSWPFAMWGMDLISLLQIEKRQAKYVIAVIDYFMKWTEVESLTSITERKIIEFI